MVELNGLHINVAAILVAALASFLLTFLWYGKLFAAPWAREMGYDPSMRPGAKTMVKGMLLSAIGNFLFAWVLAFYFAGWRMLPGSPSEVGALAFSLNSGLSVVIGFFVPIQLARVVWERHPWKLFGINLGLNVVSTLLVALILGFWT